MPSALAKKLPPLTFDAPQYTRAQRFAYSQVRRAEIDYASKLRALARQVVQLARMHLQHADPDNPRVVYDLADMLDRYGDALTPWARAVATRMLLDVDRRDTRIWRERAKDINWGLMEEIQKAPTGELMQQRLRDQVDLITSLPRNVASDVHQMAIEHMATGQRAAELRDKILARADVTVARANLIARTEVARTTTELTRARAEHVGSDGYIWRTAHDADVRPALSLSPTIRSKFVGSHRALEGKFIPWDDPPVSGQRGERAHAGQIYNCRCVPEPVIPGVAPLGSWRPRESFRR